ncbi:allantoate amidohydrolase [Vibrio sp. WXL210]|uniref:allantoate amidohydrolase n=1 Tax=Vibrio sp. WXL210 TaxID=3450709 RepID=UPI003EC6E376
MFETMECRSNKVMRQADQLAKYSSDADGLTRAYLTQEHQQANQQLALWMQAAGLETWVDSVGNQWGRKVSPNPDLPTIILGSHSDTVRNAGKYDGNLGILLAIEALAALSEVEFPFHIDVVAFGDEEGVRFGTTLIGSSGVAGCFDRAWLDITDADGISMAQAMRQFGLCPSRAGSDARKPADIGAYLEVHIEQGPVLEHLDLPVGVVEGIAGAKRFQIQVKGVAGHAGTVPIELRQDALCAVAEMIGSIERFARNEQIVATVGQCDVRAGAVNVIPGEVSFSLDLRCAEQEQLEVCTEQLLAKLEGIAQQRRVLMITERLYQADALQCAPRLQQRWAAAVEKVTEQSAHLLPSGAGHDGLAMQHLTEVGMLFVRCDKGISHNPLEAVNEADVAIALRCLIEMLLDY